MKPQNKTQNPENQLLTPEAIAPDVEAVIPGIGGIAVDQAGSVVPSPLSEHRIGEFAKEADVIGQVQSRAENNLREADALLNDIKQAIEPTVETLSKPNDVLTDEEIVNKFDILHAVKRPLRFNDQLRDKKRTKKFTVFDERSRRPSRPRVMTELEGLRELSSFLNSFTNHGVKASKRSEKVGEQVEQARSIRQNLTFIGEKEYKEAAHGIGLRWKDFLEQNPDHKICVVTEVGDLDRYKGRRKSDDYLKERILDTFSNEELKRYSGRIVQKVRDVRNDDPQNVRVILLDDWVVSGKQARDVFKKQMDRRVFQQFYENGNVEVNNIAASRERLADGLLMNPYEQDANRQLRVPVFAYYQAHHAPKAQTEAKSHVSGLHSSVNYDFSDSCKTMQRMLKRGQARMPGLTSVMRAYRYNASQISIKPDRIKRIKPYGESSNA